jgi:hypothetical protein
MPLDIYHNHHVPLKLAFTDKFLINTYHPCLNKYNTSQKYMYMSSPPSINSSYGLRNPPVFTKDAVKGFGIFAHTGIFGNYTNQRICSKKK